MSFKVGHIVYWRARRCALACVFTRQKQNNGTQRGLEAQCAGVETLRSVMCVDGRFPLTCMGRGGLWRGWGARTSPAAPPFGTIRSCSAAIGSENCGMFPGFNNSHRSFNTNCTLPSHSPQALDGTSFRSLRTWRHRYVSSQPWIASQWRGRKLTA